MTKNSDILEQKNGLKNQIELISIDVHRYQDLWTSTITSIYLWNMN